MNGAHFVAVKDLIGPQQSSGWVSATWAEVGQAVGHQEWGKEWNLRKWPILVFCRTKMTNLSSRTGDGTRGKPSALLATTSGTEGAKEAELAEKFALRKPLVETGWYSAGAHRTCGSHSLFWSFFRCFGGPRAFQWWWLLCFGHWLWMLWSSLRICDMDVVLYMQLLTVTRAHHDSGVSPACKTTVCPTKKTSRQVLASDPSRVSRQCPTWREY